MSKSNSVELVGRVIIGAKKALFSASLKFVVDFPPPAVSRIVIRDRVWGRVWGGHKIRAQRIILPPQYLLLLALMVDDQ